MTKLAISTKKTKLTKIGHVTHTTVLTIYLCRLKKWVLFTIVFNINYAMGFMRRDIDYLLRNFCIDDNKILRSILCLKIAFSNDDLGCKRLFSSYYRCRYP